MAAWGNQTDRMILALERLGCATRAQIQKEAGDIPAKNAARIVNRLMKPVLRGKDCGKKRIYISSWTHEQEGERDHLRPMYSIGNKQNAKKPPVKCMKVVNREYLERKKQREERFAPGSDLQRIWIGR